MSTDNIRKYFEVRLFSLVLAAITVFVLFVFLFLLFIMRGQYIYAVLTFALAALMVFAAVKLWQYAQLLRRKSVSSSG